MRTSAELREGFLSFFEEHGHRRHPSGSLVPPGWDHSTLLTSAGMQPGQRQGARVAVFERHEQLFGLDQPPLLEA